MNYGVILLGGLSKRFNSDKPKQFMSLGDHELFELSLKVFLDTKEISEIILVVHESYLMHVNAYLEKQDFKKRVILVKGGLTRQQSVFNALTHIVNSDVYQSSDRVIIHDGARPLIKKEDITNVIKPLDEEYVGSSLAIKESDTVARLNEEANVEFIDRNQLFRIQTPQAFVLEELYKAHQFAKERGLIETSDDLQILHLVNDKIKLVKGRSLNIKVTTYDDYLLLENLLKEAHHG